MQRRQLLAAVGIGLTTAVAGCTSQASTGEGEDAELDTTTATGTETETETAPEPTAVAAGETTTRTIGTGSLDDSGMRKSHNVVLTNQTETSESASLTITQAGKTVLDERFELASKAAVAVPITDLGSYEVRATLTATDATETVTISLEQFTCNVTRTTIGVTADRALTSGSVSTLMACPGVVTERVPADGSTSKTLGDEPVLADTGKGTHTVLLRNPTDETWTARIQIRTVSAPQFDGLYTVESNGTVLLTLSEDGNYALDIGVIETGATATEEVGPKNFECNRSSTRGEITTDGGLDVATSATLMACETDVDNGTTTANDTTANGTAVNDTTANGTAVNDTTTDNTTTDENS
ncbi:hypothetical protein [Haloferax mucosum]|uniref:hypothetical protein n=1 Tax=Haloferax mucosum TaxID=403181 RepID=UPI00032103A6|nr:hypothetical protein [Haloferax mucosum]